MTRRSDRRVRSRPGVRRAVALVVLATLVVVVVTGSALFATQRELREVQSLQQDRIAPARLDVARLLALVIDQETGYRGYILTAQASFLDPYTQGQAEVGPLLDRLASETAVVPGMADRLVAVRAAQVEWRERAAEKGIEATRAGDRATATALVASGLGKLLFDEVRRAHSSAEVRLAAYEADLDDRSTELSRRLSFLLGGTLALLALLAALIALTLERSILRPLRHIGGRVRRVSAGELDQVVEGDGPREFRDLARDVDTMRRRMLDEIDSARHASEALALREPTVAALRAALAPTLRSVDGVEIAARLEPAEGVLAGDFVDSVVLADDRLGIVLGDVAGHGPGPAIFGLRLKLLLGSLLAGGLEPGEVLGAALARIDDVTEETFATVVIAVVDRQRGEIRYANAGHPAPLLLGQDGRGEDTTRELTSTGPFLSPLLPQAVWATRVAPFESDDLLLAYTDGVVEARDLDGRELGLQRTVEALAGRPEGEELSALIDVLYGEIRDHAAELKDDTTLVLCRRSPTPLSASGEPQHE